MTLHGAGIVVEVVGAAVVVVASNVVVATTGHGHRDGGSAQRRLGRADRGGLRGRNGGGEVGRVRPAAHGHKTDETAIHQRRFRAIPATVPQRPLVTTARLTVGADGGDQLR